MDASPIALDRAALFLDFDGTLVEIAPRPDAVVVPEGLPALLQRLAARMEGALAIVSGRPLAQLDALLPVPLAMAGDHGASLRPVPGGPVESLPLPAPPAAWRERVERLAAGFPGAWVELKPHGLVLHYRQAPEAGPAGRELLDALIADNGDFVMMPARMAWEVKPTAISKATAVAGFMARRPFAGRMPVFVGDDVTDEAGMAAARAAGGLGLKLQDAFGTPAAFREWLARLESGAVTRA
jgi:trehalose 6-phosphate phosphatase